MSQQEQTAARLKSTECGLEGGTLITDTTAHTGTWYSMLVLSNAAFTTLTTEYTKNDATTLAVASDWGTLTAGMIFSGKITAVTLASGSVLMLK